MSIFRSKWSRFLLRKLRLPNDEANVSKTIENIRAGVSMYGAGVWILVAAIFIASLGLNTNSTAVIIGAMLISPLMGPIVGFGLALGINDIELIKKSLRNFVLMVVVSVITSTCYFLISPVKEAGSELLGRTAPTIYDVLIAFVGGLAGIIAGASRLRTSNVVPGVAIATALMPPLCTMGYGISLLRWEYIAGAFYLFMINSVFICMATYFVVSVLGYPKAKQANTAGRKRVRWIITVLAVLTIAPSIYLTYHIVKKYFFKRNAELFISKEIANEQHIIVTSKLEYKPGGSSLQLVLLGDIIDSAAKKELESKMLLYNLYPCQLTLFQGPDSRAAAKGMFQELHSDVTLQQLSIKDIYLRMDSLQQELRKVAVHDSLQASLAKKLYSMDTSLASFAIKPVMPYNPGRGSIDTTWQVTLSFARVAPRIGRDSLHRWLSQQLKPGLVKLDMEIVR